MDIINKIGEFKTPAIERIKNYFTDLNYSESEQFSRCCELVYCGDKFDLDPDIVKTKKDISMSFISSYQSGVLLNDVTEAIKELAESYNITYLWVMIYPPKDRLSFHADNFSNRHSLTFNYDDRFYNYEFNMESNLINGRPNNPHEHIAIFNENFQSAGESLDNFNEFFVNHHENCKITSLDPTSIYTFGDTIHSFANDTQDKVRFNFIFEIQE
jgi:hypothetical protein